MLYTELPEYWNKVRRLVGYSPRFFTFHYVWFRNSISSRGATVPKVRYIYGMMCIKVGNSTNLKGGYVVCLICAGSDYFLPLPEDPTQDNRVPSGYLQADRVEFARTSTIRFRREGREKLGVRGDKDTNAKKTKKNDGCAERRYYLDIDYRFWGCLQLIAITSPVYINHLSCSRHSGCVCLSNNVYVCTFVLAIQGPTGW